jgi:hypothetical protein
MVKQAMGNAERVRSGSFGAALLASLACSVANASEPAPCTATAGFDVEHAIVGQQVGYRVRIVRRDDVSSIDWVEPPTFPGFRAEWLPDIAEPADPKTRTRRYQERRALFPEHAGTLSSTRARLSCHTDDGISSVVVASVSLRVESPPTRDQPGDFAGLIGPLAVERIVTPRLTHLGGSIRVAVMLRGEGNLWIAEDPIGPIHAADVFRRRPRTSLDTGSRLTVRRHFVYDVVPLHTGEFEIPAIHVAYFDASQGRFDAVRAEAMTVAVQPAANVTVSESLSGTPESGLEGETFRARNTAANAPDASLRAVLYRLAIAGAAIAAIAGVVALARRRSGRRRIAATASALAAISDGTGEAEAIARALRLAIAPHVEGAAAQTAEELAANPALPERVTAAVRLLAEAERARFDPTAEVPDRDLVRNAIEQL